MTKKVEKVVEIENNDLSYDTKTLITVITLVTIYPVGLILMFVWMRWSKLVKFLIALPVLMILLIPIFVLLIAATVAIRVASEPEKSVKTFEMIRNEVRKEMVISPTATVVPTKMVVKVTSGAVKK